MVIYSIYSGFVQRQTVLIGKYKGLRKMMHAVFFFLTRKHQSQSFQFWIWCAAHRQTITWRKIIVSCSHCWAAIVVNCWLPYIHESVFVQNKMQISTWWTNVQLGFKPSRSCFLLIPKIFLHNLVQITTNYVSFTTELMMPWVYRCNWPCESWNMFSSRFKVEKKRLAPEEYRNRKHAMPLHPCAV